MLKRELSSSFKIGLGAQRALRKADSPALWIALSLLLTNCSHSNHSDSPGGKNKIPERVSLLTSIDISQMTSARERLSRRFAHRKTRESRTPTKETLQHPSSSLLGRLQIELESDVRQFSGWQWTPSTGTQQRAIASPTDAQAELQLTYYLEGLNRSSKSGPAHLVAEASMVLTDSQGKVLMQERSSHRSNSFTDMRAGNIIMNAQAEKMFREVGTQAATHHRQNLQKFFNKN